MPGQLAIANQSANPFFREIIDNLSTLSSYFFYKWVNKNWLEQLMKNQPPRYAQRFFRWYCRNELRDSILGDLEEQFRLNLEKHGLSQAKLRYWLAVLLFINRFTLRSDPTTTHHYSNIDMFKSNLVSSIRFLTKNGRFTAINIFGLTLSFTSVLLIAFFVHYELSFDRFHSNQEDLYRINFAYQDNAGNITKLVNSPPALAPGVTGQFPELNRITRLRYAMNCLLVNGEKRYYEDHGYYADSLFLEMFRFDFSAGDATTALDQPNSIVITSELAHKYFNKPDPIGEILVFNNDIPLEITGVIDQVPENSHLDFNFLVSFSTYQVPDGYSSDLSSWRWLGFLTYVELKSGSDPQLLEQKLVQFFEDITPENRNAMIPSLHGLAAIYLGSQDMSDDLASHIRSGSLITIKALIGVALVILLVAGFNFALLTNALAVHRRKSTGVRKVMGSDRNAIRVQLISESLMLALICGLLSLGLSAIILPYLSEYLDIPGNIHYQQLISAVLLASIMAILIGVIAGAQPAIRLANLGISSALKGSVVNTSRNPLQIQNVLVTLQFAISFGLIACTIVMTGQINHLQSQSTGYQKENVVVVKMLPQEMSSYYDLFKERLVQQASVRSVSRSERVLGDPWPFSSIRRVDQYPQQGSRIFFNLADYDYFETMAINLLSGRSFSEDYANEREKTIVVNQQAVKELGLDDPIGQQVHFFELDGPRTIIGVVEDFNYASLHDEIGPAAVVLPFIDLEYMYIRLTPGDPRQQIELIEEAWVTVAQTNPLAWRFLDEKLDQLYTSEERLSQMIMLFSALAIVLACLGLFGVVSLMISKRIKEFGVRKVLGATVASLYLLFVQKYIVQIILAAIVIIPILHHLLSGWLANFAYHIDVGWWVYLVAALGLVLITMLTISFRTVQAARTNPSGLLRYE